MLVLSAFLFRMHVLRYLRLRGRTETEKLAICWEEDVLERDASQTLSLGPNLSSSCQASSS